MVLSMHLDHVFTFLPHLEGFSQGGRACGLIVFVQVFLNGCLHGLADESVPSLAVAMQQPGGEHTTGAGANLLFDLHHFSMIFANDAVDGPQKARLNASRLSRLTEWD